VLQGGDQLHLAVDRNTVEATRERVAQLENH
jgi:hypothetical protein